MTMVFLFVIMGATDSKAPAGFTYRDWSLFNLDPPYQYPRNEYFSKPSSKYRSSHVCWRLGRKSIVAILGRSDSWSRNWRNHLQRAVRGRD